MNIIFHFLETTKQHTQDLQSSYQSLVCKVYIKVNWFVFICCRQQHERGNCSDLDLEDFVYAHRPILSGQTFQF